MSVRGRSLLLAAAGGGLAGVCWLPFGLAPFLPLAFVLAFRGLRLVRTPRDAVWFGLTMGAVRHAVGGHYILALVRYSPLAVVISLLDIAYILPFAVVEAWGSLWIERRTGVPRTVAFPVVYSALEWTRTLGDLSVPSDLLAHAFGTHPQWLVFTAWTGPYFLSLLAGTVAALLDAAIERRTEPRRAAAAATAAAVLWFVPPLTNGLVADAGPSSAGSSLRVGIVQPSVTIEEKLDPDHWPQVLRRLRRLTREASRRTDLVIWPETARPGPVVWRQDEPFSDPPMEKLAGEMGVPILYGCEIARVSGEQVVALHNGAALARPDGGPGEWYGKQRLLPFVEGVPFADWLGWDPAKARRGNERSYLTLMGNFVAGPRPTVFHVGPARIGVLICYEGLYPQLVRRFRRAGANMLCVMTNDAWWGRTVFPIWHARMIAARAREADVPVVRAANSGVSSATDRLGRLGEATELFEVTSLRVEVDPSDSAPTFYARHGDLLVWVLWAIVAVLAGLGLAGVRLPGRRPTA